MNYLGHIDASNSLLKSKFLVLKNVSNQNRPFHSTIFTNNLWNKFTAKQIFKQKGKEWFRVVQNDFCHVRILEREEDQDNLNMRV